MNKRQALMMVAAVAAVAGMVLVPGLSQDLADAKSTKKIHFTKTLDSMQDPGLGHENHQMALLLPPRSGIIYDGSLTYAADRPVRVAVLHEIDPSESRGQPVWTVDGKTTYGLSLIGTASGASAAGSSEFTGAALALHSADSKPFVATASVDGWVRGGAVEVAVQPIAALQDPPPPSVDLFRAQVPATIPMHGGLYGGGPVLYIITDSSDGPLAVEISERQDRDVGVTPTLSGIPGSVTGEIYLFTNGVRGGGGLYGFQNETFSTTPAQRDEYSALRKVIHVSWKSGQFADTLDSVEEIVQAERDGRIELEDTGIVLNAPQIVWPGGQMQIRGGGAAATAADQGEPYGGGQILEIDAAAGTVTFVAHRGWGPDGRTVYCIVTDATPSGPAAAMGVVDAPTSAELVAAPDATADLYQFKNGLAGTGPLGFQPAIAAAAPGDGGYSPMWRVLLVEWNDGETPRLLETPDDIDSARGDGLVTVGAARPTNSDYVVNCPFVDP